MKKQTGEDRLIIKYGAEIVNEAVQHFISIDKHCVMSQLDEMCDYIKRIRESRK